MSPGAIEEIYGGFKGITGQVKQYANEIKALKAELPSDLKSLGEPGLDALKNMIRNGVDTAAAEKVLHDETVQGYMAYFETLEKDYRSGTISFKDFGMRFLGTLNNIDKYLDSIPYPEERVAIQYGLQLAIGGPFKTVLAVGVGLVAGDFIKTFKDSAASELAARVVYGKSGEEHLSSSSMVGYDGNSKFFEGMTNGADFGLDVFLGVVTTGVAKYVGGKLITKSGTHIEIESKIAKQMPKRGWDVDSIDNTISKPHNTVVTTDTRYDKISGARLNEPATAYINKDGSYVVRNDISGKIVQVSDKYKPDWVAPWQKK